jgi:hypothetical protein
VGRHVGTVATVVVAAVVVWSMLWNLGELSEGADIQRFRAEQIRAQLAAVDLAAPAIDPDYDVGALLIGTRAGPYLEVADEYGSPAYSLDELRAAPAHARRSADVVLVEGTGPVVEPLPNEGRALPPCPASRGTDDQVFVAQAFERPLTVRARMFGDHGVPVATIPRNSARLVRLPRVEDSRWRFDVTPSGTNAFFAECSSAAGR